MFWSKDKEVPARKDKTLESTIKVPIPAPPPNLNADNLDINTLTKKNIISLHLEVIIQEKNG